MDSGVSFVPFHPQGWALSSPSCVSRQPRTRLAGGNINCANPSSWTLSSWLRDAFDGLQPCAGRSEKTEDPKRGRWLPFQGPRSFAGAGRAAALGDCTAAGQHVPHLSPVYKRERVQPTLPLEALSHEFELLCLFEFCGTQAKMRGLCCVSLCAVRPSHAGTGVALVCPAGRGAQARTITITARPESLTSPIVSIPPGSWCSFPRLHSHADFPSSAVSAPSPE